MNWETILASVIASAITGGLSGFLGMKIKLALVESKTDTNAQEILRVRDHVHTHANLLHVLQGRMNGKH